MTSHRIATRRASDTPPPPIVRDEVALAGIREDAAHYPGGHASGVAHPRNEAEVAALLRQAARVLPVGAQSSLTGGATPMGDLVIATTRMDRILRVDGGEVAVEPGVPLSLLQETLRRAGAWFPPAPTFDGAFAGGIVATNAAGAATFKYGSTRDWVRRLTVVLATGDVLEIDRDAVRSHDDGYFELDLSGGTVRVPVPDYRMPPVVKCSAGYFARPGMDLIDLFIGSEGTLGIVTEMTFRVISPAPAGLTVWTTLTSERDAVDLVARLRDASRATWRDRDRRGVDVAGVEHLDRRCLDLVRATGAARRHGIDVPDDTSVALLAQVELPADVVPTAADAYAQIAAAETGHAPDTPLVRLCRLVQQAGVLDRTEIVLPHDTQRRDQLAAIREAVPDAVNRLVGDAKRTVDARIDKTAADMIVPFEAIGAGLDAFRAAFERRGLDYAIWGHLSDGNLHPNVIPRSLAEVQRGRDAILECGDEVVRLGGCPLAEHGVGRNPVKQTLLRRLYGDAGIEQMRRVKAALDPAGKLAPGVLFPARQAGRSPGSTPTAQGGGAAARCRSPTASSSSSRRSPRWD